MSDVLTEEGGSKSLQNFRSYSTGFLSQLRAKLRYWAVRPVRAGCYSWAALWFIGPMGIGLGSIKSLNFVIVIFGGPHWVLCV